MPSPAMRHARQERGIASRAEQIFHAKSSFVAGNPNGDVSVVTFLDYNCLYCREGRRPTSPSSLRKTARYVSC